MRPSSIKFFWINYQGDTKARKAQIHSLDFGHETLVTLKGHKGSGRSVNLATAMFQLLCATVLLCLCNADQPQGPTEARHFVAMGIFDMVKWPYVNAKIAVLKVIWDLLVLEAKRNLMNIDLKWIKMTHIAASKDPPAVTFLPYLGAQGMTTGSFELCWSSRLPTFILSCYLLKRFERKGASVRSHWYIGNLGGGVPVPPPPNWQQKLRN